MGHKVNAIVNESILLLCINRNTVNLQKDLILVSVC